MIKANEIRIGNLYERKESLANDKIGYINFDESDWYRIGEGIDYLENYDPIPLTEEWILKFGMVYNGHMYSNGSNLVVSKNLNWIALYLPRHEDDVEIDCPKYVHQLQTLYFALTGQELELK